MTVHCDDGRSAKGSHALLAIGSVPNSEGLGLDAAGVEADGGYVPVDEACRTNVPHIYAAGDLSGSFPLSSVAAMQGRRIAEHVMGVQSRPAASSTTTRPHRPSSRCRRSPTWASRRPTPSPRVARCGSRRCPSPRRPKALIESHSRGFVKIVSDPATGVVLGGSVVGRHAAS